ncbi:MAG TPA: hypothetical protein VGR93_02930 [Candidatus Acidoferrales bacterium]|nr:hypothetical protein [Candidatus Acidoferrales bacterium]
MKLAGLFFAILLAFGIAAHADELHLKDGTKVIGTIVGYQGNSFRVKTSYGFALVERSSVVSITVTKSDPKPAATENSRRTAEGKPFASNQNARNDPSASNAAAKNSAISASVKEIPAPAKPVNAQPAPASATAAPNANPAAAAAAPAAPPEPPPMREEVLNNLYVNETYGFRIYKPPEWELIQGARAALPGAIAALGTSDQTTYLIIGLEPTGDTLMAHVEETNGRLADSFDDFRPGPLRKSTVAGMPACEYRFEGMADKQPWSGTVVLIRRGENIFTIFGVTTGNSDLVQIQQNVIARAIASLQFTTPQ